MKKNSVFLLFLLFLPLPQVWGKIFLLEWKWKKGEKIHYREVLEISPQTTTPDFSFQGRGKLEREFFIQAISTSKTRGFQLKIHWKRIIFHLKKSQGREIHFDSKNYNNQNFKNNPKLQKDPILKNLFAFYQREIFLRILPSGKVVSTSKNPSSSSLPWEDFFLLPLRPVEVGSLWQRKTAGNIWNTDLKTHLKYRLEKVEKYKQRLCVRIGQEGRISLRPSIYSRYKRLVPKVTISKASGWKLFDFQKGKLVAAKNKVDFEVVFRCKRGGKAFSRTEAIHLRYRLEIAEK